MTKMKIEIKCRDFERPGCLETPDDRYTLNFDDLGEPPIYFCTSCGKIAQEMMDILEKAFKEGGLEFLHKLESLITKAETDKIAKQS